MPRLSRLSVFATVIAVVLAWFAWFPRVAAAQAGKQGIHVVAIDSDDADEQADALTGAIRSHIRETPGWTLLETTQSLSMLTASLRCPTRPDAQCLVRIGDKLLANQFIWGVMTKATSHQVSVDLHLWTRGKPDQVARDTFSDNMKEPNDDALKRVATQLLTKLLGPSPGQVIPVPGVPGGAVSVHVANVETGNVLVDGEQKATLDHGRATVQLPVGPHSVQVQSPGFNDLQRDVTITAGASVPLELTLEAAPPEAPSKPFPIRKVATWGAIGVGGVLVVVGGIYGGMFLSDKSALNNDKDSNHGTNYGAKPSIAGLPDPCHLPSGTNQLTYPTAQQGCTDLTAARSAEVAEVVTLALGGALVVTGVVLLVTNHPDDAPAAQPAAPKTGLSSLQFLPAVGPGNGSLTVVGRF
jgi:hypothetical protein